MNFSRACHGCDSARAFIWYKAAGAAWWAHGDRQSCWNRTTGARRTGRGDRCGIQCHTARHCSTGWWRRAAIDSALSRAGSPWSWCIHHRRFESANDGWSGRSISSIPAHSWSARIRGQVLQSNNWLISWHNGKTFESELDNQKTGRNVWLQDLTSNIPSVTGSARIWSSFRKRWSAAMALLPELIGSGCSRSNLPDTAGSGMMMPDCIHGSAIWQCVIDCIARSTTPSMDILVRDSTCHVGNHRKEDDRKGCDMTSRIAPEPGRA